MQANDGIRFGKQPGYCKTWITGVSWQSSRDIPFEIGSSHLPVMTNTKKKAIAVLYNLKQASLQPYVKHNLQDILA